MLKLREIKKCNTVEDLEKLGIGSLNIDISHRGGGVGFYRRDICLAVKVSENDIPRYFGAGCNYLGGGIRGSIFGSGYNTSLPEKKQVILQAIQEACIRAYENLESEIDADDPTNCDPNWEAIATKKARQAGIVSAY